MWDLFTPILIASAVRHRELPEERAARELRDSLAAQVNRALRMRRDEVIHHATSVSRDSAANAVYQAGIGVCELESLFTDAAQAVAAGETFGVIGERFAAYMRAASAHYVEVVADGIEDDECPLRVTYEARQ